MKRLNTAALATNVQVRDLSPGRRLPTLTTKELAELLKRFDAGESIIDLSTSLGVHRDTVRSALAKAGKAKPVPKRPTKQDIRRAVELYSQGLPLKAVATELGFGKETIRKHLHRAGVQVRPRGSG